MVEYTGASEVVPELQNRYRRLMGTLEIPTISLEEEPRVGPIPAEMVVPEAGVTPMWSRQGGPVYVKVELGTRPTSEAPVAPFADVGAWLNTIAAEAHPGRIANLASIGREYALAAGKPETAEGLTQLEGDSRKVASMEELTDTFGDYNEALMGLESARVIIRDAAEEATIESDDAGERSDAKSAGLLSKLREMLSAAGSIVASTFQRLAGVAEDRVNSFVEITKRLVGAIGSGVRDAVVSGFRAVFRALGALASKVISLLLAWADIVRKTAKESHFTLTKFTIRIPSSSWENVSVMGFSVPIPVISSPEMQFEFA